MRKYIKEIIVLALQLFMFYIFPLFAGPTDVIGMVVLIIVSTAILALILGITSKQGIKFAYPLAVSILFIPSVFIYYNETALVHALWYLVVSGIGLGIGSLIRLLFCRK